MYFQPYYLGYLHSYLSSLEGIHVTLRPESFKCPSILSLLTGHPISCDCRSLQDDGKALFCAGRCHSVVVRARAQGLLNAEALDLLAPTATGREKFYGVTPLYLHSFTTNQMIAE
jgi:hypothetical protein